MLALQEVDFQQPRSDRADLTAVAAEAMGAVEHRFVAAIAGTPGATWMAATGHEQPGAAAYGIALLSRYPVVSWRVVRLPALRASVPMWFQGSRRPVWVRDEPRVAVAAVLDGALRRVHHLQTRVCPSSRRWSALQLQHVVRFARPGAREPDGVRGRPEHGAAPGGGPSTGLRPIVSAATFPLDAPRRQLDHVLVRGRLTATGPGEDRPVAPVREPTGASSSPAGPADAPAPDADPGSQE